MKAFAAILVAIIGVSLIETGCNGGEQTAARHDATAASPSPLGQAPPIWPNFYGPTQYDFDRAHLAPIFRRKVLALVQRLPPPDRLYARWLPYGRDVIVFEVNPRQLRSDGRGYSPSPVIGMRGLYVDPTDGRIFAMPH